LLPIAVRDYRQAPGKASDLLEPLLRHAGDEADPRLEIVPSLPQDEARLFVTQSNPAVPQQLPHDRGGHLELTDEYLAGGTRHRSGCIRDPLTHDRWELGTEGRILRRQV